MRDNVTSINPEASQGENLHLSVHGINLSILSSQEQIHKSARREGMKTGKRFYSGFAKQKGRSGPVRHRGQTRPASCPTGGRESCLLSTPDDKQAELMDIDREPVAST